MNDWMAHEFLTPNTNSYFPVEIELGSFLNIGRQFRKKIFCLNHFALIAKEIAVFSQFLPVGGLFFHILALAPCGMVKSSCGRRQKIRNFA
jgi:hypothetical protein